MKVLFIQDNGINESLLLTELSAYLKQCGHQTAVLLQREHSDMRAETIRENPDLIFIPSSVLAHHWSRATAAWAAENFPDIPRVLAGSHPTFYPDIINSDGVDMIIVGEAEYPTAELLDALAGKRPIENIANLHIKQGKTVRRNELRPLLDDLDILPPPDRDLYFARYDFMADFPWKKFTSGRGCFHNCSYCYQPTYRKMASGKGKYIRRKSPERIVAEVADIAGRYRLGNAHFSDDLFITSPGWLEEFAEIYPSEVGTPFSINTSAEFVTEKTAKLLARAGCRAAAIGIETYNEKLRRDILRKKIDNETIRKAARLIKENGMTLVTFNMVASPNETVADSIDTMKFNAELGVDYARVSVCFPIPETEMARSAIESGICLDGYSGDIYALPDITESGAGVSFSTAQTDESRFINLYYLFNLGVSYPKLIPLIERAIKAPRNPLFASANFLRMYREKTTFRFSLLDGFRYWRHVGSPDKRASNFVSLI